MNERTMIALTSDALGDTAAYGLRKVPTPEPAAHQVRLRVEATALGYVDALIAAGGYQVKPAIPFVPGAEIVGIVDKVGTDVTGVTIGDRVATWQLIAGGGVAEFALARGDALVPVPDRLASTAAASLMLDHLTAWHALFDRGNLKAGESVLVLGAAGGIGAAAVQIASGAGARVIAGASTAEKRARARQLGAEAAIDYLAADWRDQLRKIVPDGVDVVVDPVGGATFEPAFRSLAKRGRHLVLGFAGGGDIPRLPINLPLLKSGALIGVDARYLFESDPGRAIEIWTTLFRKADEGSLLPPDVDIHPLRDAEAAFGALMKRDRQGKIVIIP